MRRGESEVPPGRDDIRCFRAPRRIEIDCSPRELQQWENFLSKRPPLSSREDSSGGDAARSNLGGGQSLSSAPTYRFKKSRGGP